MAEWAVTTAGARLEFDTLNATYNSCYKIDSNHFINFWGGDLAGDFISEGYVQVFTVNTSTWGVTTAAEKLQFDTGHTTYRDCYQVDANHFINFWSGEGSDGYVQVFTVNTSTWAVTTAANRLEFDATNGQYNSCYQIDSNHFINFWAGSGIDGYVQVFTVNTSTWAVTTAAATLEFDTVNGTDNSCYKIDANHFINFWSGEGIDGYVQIFTVNTSTWAVTTAGARLEFDTLNATYNSCYQIDSNHFINFWAGDGTDGFVQVFAVNTSTWAVTTANARLEFDTVNGAHNSCYQIDSNHFINFWAGEGTDGYVQVFTVNTSTWAVTTANASLEFDTVNNASNSCYQIDSNHFINFWAGTDSDGFVQVFAVELPATGGTTVEGQGTSTITVTDAAILIGTGVQTGAANMAFSNAAILAGTGVQSGVSQITFSDAAILAGTGLQSGATAINFTDSAAIAGQGSQSGAAQITFTDAAALQGEGSQAGATSIVFTDSAAIAGEGSQAGQSAVIFSDSATIIGTGAQSGTSTITITDSAELIGNGAQSGTTAIVFTDAAALIGDATLQGESDIAFSNAAAMEGQGTASAQSDIQFSTASILGALMQGQGTAEITFLTAATIEGTGNVVAATNITFTTDGGLYGLTEATAQALVQFAATAAIQAEITGSAATGITFDAEGIASGTANLSGASQIQVVTAAEAQGEIIGTGIATITISATGALIEWRVGEVVLFESAITTEYPFTSTITTAAPFISEVTTELVAESEVTITAPFVSTVTTEYEFQSKIF